MFWTLQEWQLVILFYFTFVCLLPVKNSLHLIVIFSLLPTDDEIWHWKLAFFFSAFIACFFQQLKRQWTIASASLFDFSYNNNPKKICRNTVAQSYTWQIPISLLENPKTNFRKVNLKKSLFFLTTKNSTHLINF